MHSIDPGPCKNNIGISMSKDVKIAIHMNHPDSDCTDMQGNKFYGWNDIFDEWINLYSARIAPHKQHTGEGFAN